MAKKHICQLPTVPQCNCRKNYERLGMKITHNVKHEQSKILPTRLNADGETCDLCGFYVCWRPEDWKGRTSAEAAPVFDDVLYDVRVEGWK